ncbi:MAG TPA: tail fiber domain-containing protein, partial [Spirochaetota bacterium]|nr:tail fiber domain-containing protein [Spirochaetota bacterium]
KSNPDKQIGVIAQDVEKVFPELVTIQKDGMRSVNYNGLIAPTIEAIKELKSQKDSEIAALKKENEELREEINLIKEKLGIK